MESYIIYLVKVSCISLILYAVYYAFLRKDKNLRMNRTVLLSIILFSLLIPLNPITIPTRLMGVREEPQKIIIHPENLPLEREHALPDMKQAYEENTVPKTSYSILTIAGWIYSIVSSILLLRLFIGIAYLLVLYKRGKKHKENNNTIIEINMIKNSFSFFNWIFINKRGKSESDIHKILLHEKAHSSQGHTADLMLAELFIILCCLNPASWLIKKSLRQVHEYLADEAMLNSDIGVHEYQELLLRVAAEDIALPLTSNFSYTLIKNRLNMMTKTPSKGIKRLKVMGLIPLMLLLTVVMAFGKKEIPGLAPIYSPAAFSLGQNKTQVPVTTSEKEIVKKDTAINAAKKTPPVRVAVVPTKMNVLYFGVDNPVDIVVGNSNKGKLDVTIDNGEITGSNGKYIIRISQYVESAIVTVYQNNREIYKQPFRVKLIPKPEVMIRIPGIENGILHKKDIDVLEKVEAFLPFDFDMQVKVVSFEMSFGIFDSLSVLNGCPHDAKSFLSATSNSEYFSPAMKQYLSELLPHTRIYIEQVRVILPDGTQKKANGVTYSLRE